MNVRGLPLFAWDRNTFIKITQEFGHLLDIDSKTKSKSEQTIKQVKKERAQRYKMNKESRKRWEREQIEKRKKLDLRGHGGSSQVWQKERKTWRRDQG